MWTKALFTFAILANFFIVQAGDNFKNIIISSQASLDTSRAANELRKYFKEITGLELKIIKTSNTEIKQQNAFYLGSIVEKLDIFNDNEIKSTGKFGGFIIREKNGNIYIAGDSTSSSLYGVYKILEVMGCRFWSTDYEFIPTKKALPELKGIDVISVPKYDVRLIANNHEKNGQHAIISRPACLNYDDKFQKLGWDHSIIGLVKPEIYAKSHPEYYTLNPKGERVANLIKSPKDFYVKYRVQVCMSNPEVRKIAKNSLREWCKVQPNRLFYNLTPNDGLNWCMCEKCKALDTIPGKVTTDRILNFVNDLAREMPDKLITTLAYTQFSAPPPVKTIPHKNVRIFLCPYTPEIGDRGHWFDTKENRKFFEWYQGWIKKFPEVLYIYEYPYVEWQLLSFLHEQMFYRIKRYAKDGIKGIYYCGRTPFMHQLFNYVSAKLLWDPNLPTELLVENFIKAYYDDAHPVIFKIYNRLKDISNLPDRIQGMSAPIEKFVTIEECKELLALYEEAEGVVKHKPTILSRVQKDKSFLLRTYVEKYKYSGNDADFKQFRKSLGEYLKISLTNKLPPKTRFDFMSHDMSWIKDWIYRKSGIQIKEENWFDNDTIKELMAAPDTVTLKNIYKKDQIIPNDKGWEIPLAITTGTQGLRILENRSAVIVRNRKTNFSRLTAEFKLPSLKGGNYLEVTALDDDKIGKTHIRIAVNSEEIFNAINPFEEKEWVSHKFKIPDGVLRKGDNYISIESLNETDNFYHKWLAVNRIALIVSPTSSSQHLTFCADYSESIDADFALGNSSPSLQKGIKISEKEEALEVDESTDSSPKCLSYSVSDNFNLEQGTVEFDIKPMWSFEMDKKYRTLFDARAKGNKGGILLYKYNNQKYITLLFYGKTKNVLLTASTPEFKNKWHKIALSWDLKHKVVKLKINNQTIRINKIDDMGASPESFCVGSMQNGQRSSFSYVRNFKIYNKDILKKNGE